MPAGYESGQQFMLASIADSCHSSGKKCYPAVVLICNFLIKGEGEQLFIYLKPLVFPFLWTIYIICPFFYRVSLFLLICKSCMNIKEISP